MSIEAANVSRYLSATRMRQESIERFATILDIEPEHLALAAALQSLDDERFATWWSHALKWEFTEHFDSRAAAALARIAQRKPAIARNAAARYALAFYRQQHEMRSRGFTGAILSESPAEAFIEALKPELDLSKYRRKFDPHEDALTTIHRCLQPIASPDACAALVALAKVAIEAAGHNTKTMEAHFRRNVRQKGSQTK